MTSMTKIERDLVRLIDNHNLRSTFLVKEMKTNYGIRCLPTLIALLGDGDWSHHSLFGQFKLTSLVKAAFQVRMANIVTDERFLQRLQDECFWYLNRQQLFRVSDELLFLFPERFDHLRRWIDEGGV